MGKSKFQISRSLDERIRRIISGSAESETEFSNVDSAYILGFNYGNVTNCVGLTTNYQLHHAVFPVVGLVYFKQCPNDEDIKSNLKAIRNYSSSPNGLGSFKSDKNEHLFLIYSAIGQTNEIDKRIFNFTKGAFVRRKRHRLSILNDPYCPRNVYNGIDDMLNPDGADIDSMSSAEDDQVDHLIFFIHGVGGVCDVRFRSCVEVVADFKKMANTLLAQHSNPSSGTSTPTNHHLASSLRKGFFRKHSTESSVSHDSDHSEPGQTLSSNKRVRRVECLPISWHSLTRRQTGISEQLNLIALSSVPKLRHFLNKVVMDAMLYSSGPVFTQTIMNNVGNEINRLYSLFVERHPNFTGSVSLAGHSLGSVIVFDLLAHQLASEWSSHENSCTRDDKLNNNCNTEACKRMKKTSVNTRSACYNISHRHFNNMSDKKPCSDYKNLQDLLKDMNLEEYSEVFKKEHISLENLLLLTDFDLKELQLPLGARRQLGTYINFKKVNLTTTNNNIDDNHDHDHDHEKYTQQQTYDPFINMNTGQCLIEYPQLKFKPRCFFAFGSPTPMFLNVRGIQQLSADYKLPTCDRMLNIFHPYDPLAYRFEPLIDPRFKSMDPVLIPHHKGGKRIHVQLREGFARVGHDIKHKLLGSLRNTWTSFTRIGAQNEVDVDSNIMTPGEMSPSSQDDETASAVRASFSATGPLGSSQKRRRRLTKSVSSSAEIGATTERESFESCRSSFSHPSNEGSSMTTATIATAMARNPLRRQQTISQDSDVSAPVSGLSSIIESSPTVVQLGTEDQPEYSSSAFAAGKQIPKMHHLDSTATTTTSIEVASSSDEAKPSLDKDNPIERNKTKNNADEHTGEANDGTTKPDVDPTKVGRLNAGRRIDYVLQEKPIELFNEYIFAFTSHANYWQNEDSALIILNEIYQADGVQLLDPSEY